LFASNPSGEEKRQVRRQSRAGNNEGDSAPSFFVQDWIAVAPLFTRECDDVKHKCEAIQEKGCQKGITAEID
jgi:hypothetical protein